MPKPISNNPEQRSLEPPAPAPMEAPFSDEGAANIIRFLESVRSIIGRLLSEGYTLREGQLRTPSGSEAKGRRFRPRPNPERLSDAAIFATRSEPTNSQ